jgi:hypothetical protein
MDVEASGSNPEAIQELDENTVEIELTSAEQLQLLAAAQTAAGESLVAAPSVAECAAPQSSAAEICVTELPTVAPVECSASDRSEKPFVADASGLSAQEYISDDLICRRAARADALCNATLTAAVAVVAIALVWRATSLHAHAPAIALRAAVAAVRTAPTPTSPATAPLVRETNPFDDSEVFEFPAATTEGQAREAMAALLLQRARERIAQGVALTHSIGRHHARAETPEPPEIFVTRLSAGTGYGDASLR